MDGIEPFLAYVLALGGEKPDAIRDEVRVALGDLLDGFAFTLLLAVAIGTIYYAIRRVKELRHVTRRGNLASCRPAASCHP